MAFVAMDEVTVAEEVGVVAEEVEAAEPSASLLIRLGAAQGKTAHITTRLALT